VSATANDDGLDAALDELYSVAPDEFVSTRTRLAADLKSAGATDAVKELKAARRPTVAAWVLNQLPRREPDRLEEFLTRSREVRDAAPDDLRAAIAAQRAALNELTGAALGILASRANESHRAQITATLHAAAADESVAEQLVQGRLAREIDEVGFPGGGDAPVTATPRKAAPAKRRPPRAAPPAEPPEDAGAERRRREEARRAEERARLDTTLAETERSADAAERAHEGAQRAVEQAKADLDRARRDEREAADRARKARKLVEQLRRERNRLGD
jgi:hypothetical protein